MTTFTLGDYVTEAGKLSQLGTFVVIETLTAIDSSKRPITEWPYREADRFLIFGIRTNPNPLIDYGTSYSISGSGGLDLPDQFKWVNAGATIVEGDAAVWDAPPPRDEEAGFGPDSLHSPVFRFDRIGIFGDVYVGAGTGDTLTSFPVNLGALTREELTFDFMRGGRALYPGLWDSRELTGPEAPITDITGRLLLPGDSLLLEFASPTSSPCDGGNTPWHKVLGIEGGHDLAFHTAFVTIEPDKISVHFGDSAATIVTSVSENYLSSQFRFRLRLKGADHGGSLVPDDADPFFIDNIHLQRISLPEVEVMWCRIVSPYTVLPHSATAALPVYVKLKNYGPFAIDAPLRVTIEDSLGLTLYDRALSIGRLPMLGDTVVRMPDWDAQSAPMPAKYVVRAQLGGGGYDTYSEDNATFSRFYLNSKFRGSDLPSGERGEMGYDDAGIDPEAGAGNDIPFLTKITGDGIGFNNSSGSYAVKFSLPRRDTIYGARIYFSNGNASPDAIRISLNTDDSEHAVPGDTLRQESTQTVFEDVRRGGFFNQYWPYYFPKPIVVEPGTYWIVVSQLSLDNMMVGGDLSRGGAVVAVADVFQPQLRAIYNDPYGTEWSPTNNNGDVTRSFAVQSPVGSGWQPWMPKNGFWPVGSSREAIPISPRLTAPQSGGGAYLPMIRMMVGNAVHSSVRAADALPFHLQLFPNPAAMSCGPVTCSFTLDVEARVTLAIYDALGRAVRTFGSQSYSTGEHFAVWDRCDTEGRRVAPGTYFIQLTDGTRSVSSGFILTK
jgi:hypothetical protein